MIVGTAGHIDHGKTALIRALTGTEADRLKEEKARGITIDLGFAYADLGGGAITGFIDVPGHERLVHTMLAGAGGIDVALLVVAADDGPMPQTREHLAILDLLGIHRGIVALTKADLADGEERLAEISDAIRAMLAPTGLAAAPILPVSALTGQGITALTGWLAEAERATLARSATGRFRLGVDRSFTMAGSGTVVTGTVLSGRVGEGDEVVISPAGLRSRVRGLRAQNRAATQGSAGQRVALNLAGTGKEAVGRGDVVLTPSLHAPTMRIDAALRWLPGQAPAKSGGVRVHLHVGAAEVGARVVELSPAPAPGGEGFVQLVLDQPVAAAWGDRFILRDASAQRTLGGGACLDLRPPARKRAAPERLVHLAAAREADPVRALAALCELGLVDLIGFLRDRVLPEAEAAALANAAGVAVIAVENAPLALSETALAGLREGLEATLSAFHGNNPDMQGMSRERLRLSLTPRLPKDAFATLLRADPRIRLETGFVRLATHEVRLAPDDEALWQRIAPHLAREARFRPPRVRDLAGLFDADEREVRRVLKLTARLGRTDQIAHDHFFARATVAEMAAIVADVGAHAADGWITAATFRDRVQNGRKVAIEILDFFDRHGLTIRRGDLRRVNPHRLDLFGTPGAAHPAVRAPEQMPAV